MRTQASGSGGQSSPPSWPDSEESRLWREQQRLYRETIARLECASGPDSALDIDIAIVFSLVDDLNVRTMDDPRCKDGSPVPRFTESREDVEAYLKRSLPRSAWAVQAAPDIDAQIWDDPDEGDRGVAMIPIEGSNPPEYRFPKMTVDGGMLRLAEEIPESVGGVPVKFLPPEPEFWASAWNHGKGGTHMTRPPANTAIALTLALLRSSDEIYG
jgi:hypothetical protein